MLAAFFFKTLLFSPWQQVSIYLGSHKAPLFIYTAKFGSHQILFFFAFWLKKETPMGENLQLS